MRFRNRIDGGRQLGEALQRAGLDGDVVVLGLPRGGLPVAFEVARRLSAPLDVVVVRKLGVPFQPELAMGAIGEDGVRVENVEVLRAAGLGTAELDVVEQRERVELERRARQYRGERPRLELAGKCAVIVDDGIATGSTARAACQVVRAHGAAKVVLAVPVASSQASTALADVCDEFVCVETPEPFFAVGEWYEDFSQTSDQEVMDLLSRSAAGRDAGVGARAAGDDPPRSEDVVVACDGVELAGFLSVPDRPVGTVVFAHGSGSSRYSPRNRYVAGVLNEAGLATLLVDLLTVEEESDRSCVFDVEMLAGRLADAARWMAARPEAEGRPSGFFGASTGAAAALWAAGQLDCDVAAVVSRGGRPDLAAPVLAEVRAPTLLIVGGHDELVLELNRSAQAQLRCENQLRVVPGATHLFEEPGALEQVAELARNWFLAQFQLAGG